MAQAKLVRVLKGRILDVAVDIRHGSPTFGQHVAVELDAKHMEQLFVPVGFSRRNGVAGSEPDTEVFDKVTALYSQPDEMGLLWNDPDLGIKWPVSAEEANLSDKDIKLPRLRDLPKVFFNQKQKARA